MPYWIITRTKGGEGYASSTSVSLSRKTKAEAESYAKRIRKDKANVKKSLAKRNIKFTYRVTITSTEPNLSKLSKKDAKRRKR